MFRRRYGLYYLGISTETWENNEKGRPGYSGTGPGSGMGRTHDKSRTAKQSYWVFTMIHFTETGCHNLYGQNLTLTLFYVLLLKPHIHVVGDR
jgi:hypothetical protein